MVSAEDYLKRLLLAGLLATLWIGYENLYDHAFHPVNLTGELTRLPFTGDEFYKEVYGQVHAHPLLEKILVRWYTGGFAISLIAFYAWFLLERRPKALDGAILGLYSIHIFVAVVYALFFVYPPHTVLGINPVQSPLMRMANNHFVLPSLHTTFAVFFMLYILWKERNRIVRALAVIYGVGTPIITIVLIQHWIYDALVGAILALLAFLLAARYEKQFTDLLDRWNPPKKLLWAATVTLILFPALYALSKTTGHI